MAKRAVRLPKPRATHARRVRPREFPPLRQRMPELFELPFVKPRKGCALSEKLSIFDVDYWAPEKPSDDFLAGNFQGSMYALLAAEFAARHWDDISSSILLRVIDAIADKGGVWGTKRKLQADIDEVAMGFVSTVNNILKNAAASGLLRRYALAHAAHLEKWKIESPKERASVARHVEELRRWASKDAGGTPPPA